MPKCDCRVSYPSILEDPKVLFCSLHLAAQDLFDAASRAKRFLDRMEDERLSATQYSRLREVSQILSAATSKARGR